MIRKFYDHAACSIGSFPLELSVVPGNGRVHVNKEGEQAAERRLDVENATTDFMSLEYRAPCSFGLGLRHLRHLELPELMSDAWHELIARVPA